MSYIKEIKSFLYKTGDIEWATNISIYNLKKLINETTIYSNI